MTTFDSHIGDRIFRLRQIAELDKETLASALSCCVRTIEYWERGEHKPRVGYFVRMATITGCSLEWLLTGDGDMAFGKNPSRLTVTPSNSKEKK